jgi:hypothetical protein
MVKRQTDFHFFLVVLRIELGLKFVRQVLSLPLKHIFSPFCFRLFFRYGLLFFFFYFLMVLEFKLRSSHLLSRHSNT